VFSIKLRIGGILDLSTVDWPGRPVAVVFLSGCDFRCPFCFNHKLAKGEEYSEIDVDAVVETVKKFMDFVSGVCLTGGEPTLQDIAPLCRKLKAAGLAVKLDTNGSRPDVVKKLIDERLVDFVALDIKGPLDSASYSRVTGVDCKSYAEAVKKTLQMLISSGVDYECRSPIVPGLNSDEQSLRKHAEAVKDAKVFVLEQFWPEKGTFNPELSKVKGLDRKGMLAAAKFFSNPVVKIRTRESGEEIVKR
jgi:pyruvate formate lyase activating enzyme